MKKLIFMSLLAFTIEANAQLANVPKMTGTQSLPELLTYSGFVKLTEMPANMGNYFYVVTDATNTDLLMRLGKGDDKNNVFYAEDVDPLNDKSALWGMQPFDNNNWDRATGTDATRFVFENMECPLDFVHSEDQSWNFHLNNSCEGWTDRGYVYPVYDLENAYWTLRNNKGGDYLGPWDGAGHIVDGQRVAGNKSGGDIGYYSIYAILRTDYVKATEKLGGASGVSPVDLTYLLHNAGARQKNNFHSDYPVGWTLSNEGDFKVEFGNYLSTTPDGRYFNVWQGSGNLSNREMWQSLTNMPNGTYRISITTSSDAVAQNAWLYANTESVMLFGNIDANNKVSVTADVTDGNLKIGVKLEDYQSNNLKFDEFRLELIEYDAPVSWEDFQELVSDIDGKFDPDVPCGNTGFNTKKSVDDMKAALVAAKAVTEVIGKNYKTEYQNLSDAYATFTNSIIEGTAAPEDYAADLTIYGLHESDHFARKNPSNTDRWTASKYWTVENFDNVGHGLDNDKGYDCLGFEIWWDVAKYSAYDLPNARIFQKVTLPEGQYYFGGCYPGYEPNEEQYIFASTSLLTTSEIPTKSLAFEKVKKAPYYDESTEFRGLTFTLEEASDVYLGWQANMSANGTYNIRVKGVKLLALDKTAVQETRSTESGKFGTICLPTAADVAGAKIYTVELSPSKDKLILKEAESLEAGVPYVYQASANQQTFTLTGETVKTPAEGDLLQGVFNETVMTADSYVMQTLEGGQKFYHVDSEDIPTLGRFRSYLKPLPSDVKSIGWTTDEATAIESITTEKTSTIYDLQGRRLNHLQKGLNIVNGRTVLVR